MLSYESYVSPKTEGNSIILCNSLILFSLTPPKQAEIHTKSLNL
jgi:hypothetical protein